MTKGGGIKTYKQRRQIEKEKMSKSCQAKCFLCFKEGYIDSLMQVLWIPFHLCIEICIKYVIETIHAYVLCFDYQ